jgi:hypothetical protein
LHERVKYMQEGGMSQKRKGRGNTTKDAAAPGRFAQMLPTSVAASNCSLLSPISQRQGGGQGLGGRRGGGEGEREKEKKRRQERGNKEV